MLPGGIVTSIPGLRSINRRAGTNKSAEVVVPITPDLPTAHNTRMSTSACNITDDRLVTPENSFMSGRLKIIPGLRSKNRRAGTRTLVDERSNGI
jgi:hypothetical protein